MRVFNKTDFEIYCLIWAAEQDFDTTANDLIAIAATSKVSTTLFMKIYGEFELMSDTARRAALLFNANQLLSDENQRRLFLDDISKCFFFNNQYLNVRERLFAILQKALN